MENVGGGGGPPLICKFADTVGVEWLTVQCLAGHNITVCP